MTTLDMLTPEQIAARRGDLVQQLHAARSGLPPLLHCWGATPDRPEYRPRDLLVSDVVQLEDRLMAGLPDPEHRHSI